MLHFYDENTTYILSDNIKDNLFQTLLHQAEKTTPDWVSSSEMTLDNQISEPVFSDNQNVTTSITPPMDFTNIKPPSEIKTNIASAVVFTNIQTPPDDKQDRVNSSPANSITKTSTGNLIARLNFQPIEYDKNAKDRSSWFVYLDNAHLAENGGILDDVSSPKKVNGRDVLSVKQYQTYRKEHPSLFPIVISIKLPETKYYFMDDWSLVGDDAKIVNLSGLGKWVGSRQVATRHQHKRYTLSESEKQFLLQLNNPNDSPIQDVSFLGKKYKHLTNGHTMTTSQHANPNPSTPTHLTDNSMFGAKKVKGKKRKYKEYSSESDDDQTHVKREYETRAKKTKF